MSDSIKKYYELKKENPKKFSKNILSVDKIDFWIMYLEGDLSLKELQKLLAGYV
jgi:hypothetical protein